MQQHDARGYAHHDSDLGQHHNYILPTVLKVLEAGASKRVFDLGFGNGSTAGYLAKKGYDVTGVDPSEQGVRHARQTYPDLRLEEGSAYEDLASRFGAFPSVVSLEVVEHVFLPRDYARTLYSLVEPGGVAIISTPYHGYLKNLALALSGKMDAHFTALWDYGHIKFWSERTLGILLREAGFNEVTFHRVGRIPALAKSMIAVARRDRQVAP